MNSGYLLGNDVDRALISDKDLSEWRQEDDRQQMIGFAKRFMMLSNGMREVVKQTLLTAYQVDKKRGALQKVELDGEYAKYWSALDADV